MLIKESEELSKVLNGQISLKWDISQYNEQADMKNENSSRAFKGLRPKGFQAVNDEAQLILSNFKKVNKWASSLR